MKYVVWLVFAILLLPIAHSLSIQKVGDGQECKDRTLVCIKIREGGTWTLVATAYADNKKENKLGVESHEKEKKKDDILKITAIPAGTKVLSVNVVGEKEPVEFEEGNHFSLSAKETAKQDYIKRIRAREGRQWLSGGPYRFSPHTSFSLYVYLNGDAVGNRHKITLSTEFRAEDPENPEARITIPGTKKEHAELEIKSGEAGKYVIVALKTPPVSRSYSDPKFHVDILEIGGAPTLPLVPAKGAKSLDSESAPWGIEPATRLSSHEVEGNQIVLKLGQPLVPSRSFKGVFYQLNLWRYVKDEYSYMRIHRVRPGPDNSYGITGVMDCHRFLGNELQVGHQGSYYTCNSAKLKVKEIELIHCGEESAAPSALYLIPPRTECDDAVVRYAVSEA